jgi:hypothetical protein
VLLKVPYPRARRNMRDSLESGNLTRLFFRAVLGAMYVV